MDEFAIRNPENLIPAPLPDPVFLGKVALMKDFLLLIVRLLAALTPVLGHRGTRAVLAENLLLKQQQLLVMQRSRRRAPNLHTADRLLFGFCSLLLSPRRLMRTAIILKPSTLLRFHRRLMDFKCRLLYSSHTKRKPRPNGPAPKLSQAICEFKWLSVACSTRPFPEKACPGGSVPNLDRLFFWTVDDLERKLELFKHYDNAARLHQGLSGHTPEEKAGGPAPRAAGLENYRWQSHCHGLFELPIAA
jgi:hypothetical protein